jgi:glycine/D-amino acid oxidase-like deaminating enzyme
VSAHLEDTYAEQSHAVLERLGMRTRSLDREELRRRFPYLDADIARLDLDAGVVNLPAVTAALQSTLEARGVPTLEECGPPRSTPCRTASGS